MLINQATLDALRTTLSTIFNQAYGSTQPWTPKVMTELPSTTKTNTYGWIAQQIALREWVGARVAQNLSEHSAVITNRSFEGTIEVDRDDIEDDNLGIYTNMLVPQLAEATRKHPGILLRDLLTANPTMWDGKTLFAGDHPCFDDAGSTYDNDDAVALSATAFSDLWAKMVAYKGEDGQPLGVMPNLLIVPPQLKKVAFETMNAVIIANSAGTAGVSNVLQGWADVLVVPELAGAATTWYLADVSRAIKPFAYQNRRAPQFVSRMDPSDPKVFDSKKFSFGVDYRGEVFATLPFLIARSVG